MKYIRTVIFLLFFILLLSSCGRDGPGENSGAARIADPSSAEPESSQMTEYESESVPVIDTETETDIPSETLESNKEENTEPNTDSETLPNEPSDEKYYFNDYLGIERDDVLNWLYSHEYDDYYLGTPYGNENYGFNTDTLMRPNGRFYGNSPSLNCTGFVLDVLMQSAGERAEEIHEKAVEMMNLCETNSWANDIEYYRNEVNAYYWGAFFRNYEGGKIEHYFFDTIDDLLSFSNLKKGDILFFMPDWTIYSTNEYGQPCDEYGNPIDCHIGFYWGNDDSGEDLFWHSMSAGLTGDPMDKSKGPFNQISELTTPSVYMYVLAVPLR